MTTPVPRGADTSSAGDVKAENKRLEVQFKAQHGLVVAFFLLILIFHAIGIYLFCSGFLLSRLVLEHRSKCDQPPVDLLAGYTPGETSKGCWHPKSFDKAIVIVVDALRYDFTIPSSLQGIQEPHHFLDALSVLYDTSVNNPANAFLRPFIADPPTTTLQRLKGLTTGSLPTLIDAGSNFAGTAIDEDNLVEQLYNAGKRVVHLGDDTWQALFPGFFEPNLTKPYDSFNVWDLHTVDNGVNEHLFPLLEKDMLSQWDVIFAHYLGVDHAGHRYGPDHPAMAEKLKQVDETLSRLVSLLDDKTLLVVLGDHGMDTKGDHGGESDDEVEAALWMYSKAGIFGHDSQFSALPPVTAKDRAVSQIDLVPTLALLLGLPVPFNNLGHPIEEAFIGKNGKDYQNLARVSHVTAAQIARYQSEYGAVRRLDEKTWSSATSLWMAMQTLLPTASRTTADESWKLLYSAVMAYQSENLRICKSMWARFDLVSMTAGIVVLVAALAVLAAYAQGIMGDRAAVTPFLVTLGVSGSAIGAAVGGLVAILSGFPLIQTVAFSVGIAGLAAIIGGFLVSKETMQLPLPRTFWGGLGAGVCLMMCIGFGSNSFTIFEDQQLLFFLTTFAVLMLASSLGQENAQDRLTGALNSISFLAATRLASLSRLCREEQMPFCRSSYYASATSSTSAAWQLVIPFAVAIVLPTALVSFYHRTRNYQGSAVIWIGIALRLGLALVAFFWVIDAADDGEWYPKVSKSLLKTTRVTIAQVVIMLALGAGSATYLFASPFINVKHETVEVAPSSTSKPIDSSTPNAPILTTINAKPAQPRTKLIIMGYANMHGSRYFLLPSIWILALLLLQKPMGQGALALCMISILNLLEVVDANSLHRSALGPVVLALLGSFHYFKTGHQSTLASLQWEAAFIASKTIQYPWAPIFVTMNTCGAQILCALAVPALSMWKLKPKTDGLLSRIAGAMATHILFYAAVTVATVIEAAWLRRHLMLYRIFMPKMLLSSIVVLVVDVIATAVALMGTRWSIVSVADVFGWQ